MKGPDHCDSVSTAAVSAPTALLRAECAAPDGSELLTVCMILRTRVTDTPLPTSVSAIHPPTCSHEAACQRHMGLAHKVVESVSRVQGMHGCVYCTQEAHKIWPSGRYKAPDGAGTAVALHDSHTTDAHGKHGLAVCKQNLHWQRWPL